MCIKIEKIKKLLLELLDDEDVKTKISTISNIQQKTVIATGTGADSHTETKVESKFPDLEKRLKEKELQLGNLQGDLTKKDAELANIKNQLEELKGTLNEKETELSSNKKLLTDYQREVKTLTAENGRLTQAFSCVKNYEKIYEEYLTLPDELRESLAGIFCCRTVWTFLFSGIQEEGLFEFWDFCMRDFKRGKYLEHREILCRIFDTLFDIFCSFNDNYKRQMPDTGEEFDSSLYANTSSSDAVGNIQETLLQGILYAKNDKVFKKSIVVVKG